MKFYLKGVPLSLIMIYVVLRKATIQSSLIAASESFKALDVVLTLSNWIRLVIVLVAFLHSFEHRCALWIGHAERSTGKVSAKEISECRSSLWHETSNQTLCKNIWSWRNEKSGIIKFKSL